VLCELWSNSAERIGTASCCVGLQLQPLFLFSACSSGVPCWLVSGLVVSLCVVSVSLFVLSDIRCWTSCAATCCGTHFTLSVS
jgi:hypothetical protein